MTTVGVIQARMGSTRLPGKVMYSLDCVTVLQHVIRRTKAANKIDEIVVATSTLPPDEMVARCSSREGVETYRGDEMDVLSRMYEAASMADAETVVRVTADCPLMSPTYIDIAVEKLVNEGLDYVSSSFDRTFPHGISSEIFTFESFEEVAAESDKPEYREHVTPYYYKNSEQFEVYNLVSDEIFDREKFCDRTDLRLTLDKTDDYELLRRIYEGVPYDNILSIKDAISFIDNNDIGTVNSHVNQKKV